MPANKLTRWPRSAARLACWLALAFGSAALAQEPPAPQAPGTPAAERREQARPEAPPIAGIDEWRKLDDQILGAAGEFGELERRHVQLVKEFRKNQSGFEPGSLAPAAVLARRNLSQLAGQYDELLGARRALREKLWHIGRRAAASREDLARLLSARAAELEAKKPEERAPAETEELARIGRWQRGIDRAEREGPGHFFSATLGQDIARTIFDRGSRGDGGWARGDGSGREGSSRDGQNREGQGRRGGSERDGRPGNNADAAAPPDRASIERHIRMLERQDARAKEEALGRAERIERLKEDLKRLGGAEGKPAQDAPK